MFFHNFKYTFRILFKNKGLIFWTFAFPIVLGTLFNLAFSDIENSESLKVFDIAVVENENYRDYQIYKEVFDSLSDKNNENQLFNTIYTDLNGAKERLERDEIIGYVLVENDSKVVVKSSGINETILKQVTEEITETKEIINTIMSTSSSEPLEKGQADNWYALLYGKILDIMDKVKPNIKDASISNLSYTMIEFYTLIAMACLYGAMLSMSALNDSLGNMSKKGCRVSISPTPKWITVLSSVLASYVASLIGIAILFLYTIFVLKVDYGNNLPLIILLALVGSFAGTSLGVFTASTIKSNENLKTGVIISITMLGCFLSGMMGITMKYIVDKNFPILNKINPANMITDGFYSLYYYDTLDRYYFNVVSLLAFSCILISLSSVALRRQRYDSI